MSVFMRVLNSTRGSSGRAGLFCNQTQPRHTRPHTLLDSSRRACALHCIAMRLLRPETHAHEPKTPTDRLGVSGGYAPECRTHAHKPINLLAGSYRTGVRSDHRTTDRSASIHPVRVSLLRLRQGYGAWSLSQESRQSETSVSSNYPVLCLGERLNSFQRSNSLFWLFVSSSTARHRKS